MRERIDQILEQQRTSNTMKRIQILQAFNQWLEEQGANHRVKCPHCNWSQVYDGEAIGMSPCNECNSTGYTFKPLRLEAE